MKNLLILIMILWTSSLIAQGEEGKYEKILSIDSSNIVITVMDINWVRYYCSDGQDIFSFFERLDEKEILSFKSKYGGEFFKKKISLVFYGTESLTTLDGWQIYYVFERKK